MHVLPAFALLGACVALGVLLLVQYFRRVRSKPVHVGVHLILGVAGLEGLVTLFRGTPDGTLMPAGTLGNAAGLLLLLAVMSGLASPMIARRWPRRVGSAALVTHAGVGAAGFVLFLAWAL
jgi:hypothetical protein